MIKKIYKTIYWKIKKILLNLIFKIFIFLPKNKIVLKLDKLYLLAIFELYKKKKIQESKKLANFYFLNKTKNINFNDFISVIFHHSGNKMLGTDINNFTEMAKSIGREIISSKDIILVEPDRFGKFGHMFYLDAFIKAIRLKIIDAKKIIISGDLKKYHPGALSLFKNLKEIIIDENYASRPENKEIRIYNQPSFDSIKLNNGQFSDIHVFYNKVNEYWKKKNNHIIFKIDQEEINDCINYFRDKKRIEIKNKQIVLLHVRQNRFEKYSEIRNANIETYRDGIDYLINNKIVVIRIGDKNMPEFRYNDENFIDISNDQSQQKYITILSYLSKFQITTCSGPLLINVALNKPNLYTNWAPLRSVVANDKDLIVPKMLLDTNGNIIPMTKRFDDDMGTNESKTYYDEMKIKILDNTESLLKNSIIEMFQKIIEEKKFETTVNQEKYARLCEEKKLSPVIISKEIEKIYPDFFA